MPNQPFKIFVVRESSLMNGIVLAIVGMIIIGLIYMYAATSDETIFIMISANLGMFLYALKNFIQKPELIRLDGTGIYYRRYLVTDWSRFHMAFISDDTEVGRTSDKFNLVVLYYNDSGILLEQRLNLPNTQDKSGYEIMDAFVAFTNEKTMSQ